MKKILCVLAVVAAIFSCSCNKQSSGDDTEETVIEGFKMHSVLQNNMVLQRNQDFVLWGTATPGVKVFAEPSWTKERYEGISVDGYWKVSVPVPEAMEGNPAQSIKVFNRTDTYQLENLLIGDVWILGGQSNMGIGLLESEGGEAEARSADNHYVRYFLIHQNASSKEIFDWTDFRTGGHKWESVTPSSAQYMSAIGYYFAKEVFAKTNIPVGMINTCMGGTPIKSYIPKDVYDADPIISEGFKNKPIQSSGRYNSMVHPVEPFSCRGFLWYQGEDDYDYWEIYAHTQDVMTKAWRGRFNCPADAPFYYVQLAPYALGEDYTNPAVFYRSGRLENYPLMREAQGSIRNLTANSGMAVTMDAGNPVNIHPEKKQPVGERLARLALHNDYGKTDVECCGPVLKSTRLEGGVLKLSFDHAQGLKTLDGKAPAHFYVSLDGGNYSAASAQINGTEIWLSSDIISQAASVDQLTVRHAFLYAAEVNLVNGDGLPAEPFRTDNRKTVEYTY